MPSLHPVTSPVEPLITKRALHINTCHFGSKQKRAWSLTFRCHGACRGPDRPRGLARKNPSRAVGSRGMVREPGGPCRPDSAFLSVFLEVTPILL